MGGWCVVRDWNRQRSARHAPLVTPSLELLLQSPEKPRPDVYRVAEEIGAGDLLCEQKVTQPAMTFERVARPTRRH